jgi:3',5'-cyclic AMP phosphodiesterase CpdA
MTQTDQTLTLVQVSDTHLSESHAWFTSNWPVFVDAMRADPPEVIITSGDLSFNGPSNPDDLAFAARCHAALPVAWRAIPGNHDTGEAPIAARLNQPVNDARLAAWRQHIGPSWWVQDLEKGGTRLRLIGLETALMGSDYPDEAAQAAFFEAALADRDGRAVIVFTHMPPFGNDPDDTALTTHCILPDPRRWLLDRCAAGGVVAIAAGHIHRHTVQDYRGMQIVTAPSTSFFNVAAKPLVDPESARTGFLRWTFDGSTLRHKVIRPRLFISVDMSNWTEAAKTTTNLPPRPLASPLI